MKNPCDHAFEGLADGRAICFECGHTLSRRQWAAHQGREAERLAQAAAAGGARPCPQRKGKHYPRRRP